MNEEDLRNEIDIEVECLETVDDVFIGLKDSLATFIHSIEES